LLREEKLIDPFPAVTDFKGSLSLKCILTPLVPDLAYNDLVIVDGRLASVEIGRLLFVADRIPPHERDLARKDLLTHCERYRWAMVRLLKRLQELAQ
jgi:hypothetical protein